MWIIDKILPHLHLGFPMEEAEGIKTSWHRSVLLVLAITLHNIPEGLAVGVAFGALASNLPAASLAAVALRLGLCRRCDDLRGCRRVDSGISTGKKYRHRHHGGHGRLRCHDDIGCGAGIKVRFCPQNISNNLQIPWIVLKVSLCVLGCRLRYL